MSSITEKIQLLKTNKRVGASMSKKKYDLIVEIIMLTLAGQKLVTLTELIAVCEMYSSELGNEGAWYMLQVKQDLEARNIIKVNYIADRVQQIMVAHKQPQRSITGTYLKEKIFTT